MLLAECLLNRKPDPPTPGDGLNLNHIAVAVGVVAATAETTKDERTDKPATGKKGLVGRLKGLLKLAKTNM